MRYFLFSLVFLFSVSVFAQDYEKHWNKVYAFELDGKTKSASEEVEKIYKKAKKDKNDEQIIKAFLYQSKFILSLQEDGQSKVIQNLKNEIKNSSEPNTSILNYIYARSLNDYFSQNSWKIRNRTKLDILPDNFSEWHSDDFSSEIKQAHLKSLENKILLKKIPITNYKELIKAGRFGKVTKRTLYDFLIFEYIKNLSREYYSDTVPDSLRIRLLEKPEIFVVTDFSSLKLNELITCFQELESDYLKENKREELERVWAERLNTVLNKLYLNNSETALKSYEYFSLNSQIPYYKNEAILNQTKLYQRLASKEKFPDYNKRAISLSDTLLASKRISDAFIDGEKIRKEITNKNLEFYTIKNLYEGESSRIHIQHKNIDTLYANVYRISPDIFLDEYYKSNKSDSIVKQIINNQIPEKSFEILLQNNKDFFEYSTEVLLPQFEKGKYLLVLGDDIKHKDSLDFNVGYSVFGITDISLSYINKNNLTHFLVLDRKTGKPLQGAKVSIEEDSGITDKKGELTIITKTKKEDKDKYKNILVTYQDDLYSEWFYDGAYYWENDKKENEESWEASVELYTDRAIYRPGQPLYYKGIVFQDKNGTKSVVPDVYVELEILDENDETLKKKRVKTNEFGSFSGEFLIPKNIVTGNLTIRVDEDFDSELDEKYNKRKDEHPFWDNIDHFEENEIVVKVEEYKRPTFEIVFDKEIKDYVVNDSVIITGKAKSFSGTILSNVKVSYTINRNANYTKPNYDRYYYDNKQIDFGETTTDNNGDFKIIFKAVPSEKSQKEGLPVFTYSIDANITDNQGETRSGQTSIRLGYHNLNLSVSLSDKVKSENPLDIMVNSTNLNGTFTEAQVNAKIYKKGTTDRVFKYRNFKVPEYQTISEDDFKKLFPYEPYTNIQDEFSDDELIFEKSFNTKNNTNILINNISKWSSGEYKIIVSSMDSKIGEEIISERNFEVNNPNILTNKKIFDYQQINSDFKKDRNIIYQLSTSLNEPLSVLVTAHYQGKMVYNTRIEIKEKSQVTIPFDNKWNEELNIRFFFVWENSRFSFDDEITLVSEKEELSTEIIRMNNLLEPGSGQTWSFLVKDKNEKGVFSEVLASMYDMSLDDFNVKKWNLLEKERYNYYRIEHYSGKHNIANQNVRYKIFYNKVYRNVKNETFNYFGYNFNNPKSVDKHYERFLATKVDNPSKNTEVFKGFVFSEEDGLPLPGASVVNRTQKTGTSTNLDGEFEIEAKTGDVIEISFIGMSSEIITIDKNKITDRKSYISLTSENLIDEVVVLAYGSQTKQSIAGSIATVNSDDNRLNLKGKLSGLNLEVMNSGQPGSSGTIRIRGFSSLANSIAPLYVIDGVPLTENEYRNLNLNDIADLQVLKDAATTSMYGTRGANGVIVITTKKGLEELSKVQTRQNLKETAFFYPHLTTDKNGNLSFNFSSPEALTSWKFRMLSHTKDALSGYYESVVTTQKDLMIQPNMPRFVRETDTIIIKAKVSNLSNEIHNGMAMLQLTNINDNSNIKINDDVKQFKTNPKGSETLSWKVVIPKGTQGLEYKITAKAGNFTDGEQSIIPVLPNRILVNESIPIWVRENSKKDFVFENLKNNDSKTLEHNSFTLEYTSNPTWIAIGSLPYLMEYEHECSEQIFSKLFANSVATNILEQNPKIKEVFEKWNENPTSKLEQNEELKNILLSETPWIRNSQSEEEQKKNLALLMDLQKSKSKSEQILKKLEGLQKPNGSFGWFEGSPENTFITTHIATGFGHLKKMGIDIKSDEISKKAIGYLDNKFTNLNETKTIYPYNDLHYLYTRSFYPEIPVNNNLKGKIDYKINEYKEKWLTLSLYEKGLLALILHRNSDSKTAKKILEHLKESAVIDTDFGMYWLENVNSPYWYKAPVETQALLIEAFSEISPNDATIEELKVWLIKQKQTKHWSTTKSTTLAVNALLLGKKDFVSLKDKTTFSVGKEKIKSQKLENKESETGYVKISWKADEITKDFAEVSVENKTESVGFGGLYWSYFEDLDNIKKSDSNLMKIEKELYLKKTTKEGSELVKITSETKLKLGDLVTIRLVLKVSEEMDFVHLKDMRASGFEPVDVLSKYEYKDGISYYKSTKDVATHFFFDSIDKGTYVLEYDVRVNNLGSFSNGISTLQSMYAPEYSSHTSSVRVNTSKE